MTCTFPANELFKRHYPRVVRAALFLAIVIHMMLFAFAPPIEFKPYRDTEPPDPPVVVDTELIDDAVARKEVAEEPADPKPPAPAPTPKPRPDVDKDPPFREPDDDGHRVGIPRPRRSPEYRPVPDRLPEPLDPPRAGYPRLAREAGIEGVVVIKALVGADGRVKEVSVEKSNVTRSMEEAAMRAVRQCLFSPALQGLTPVAVQVFIPFEFRLDH